jgi:hypothetical protein
LSELQILLGKVFPQRCLSLSAGDLVLIEGGFESPDTLGMSCSPLHEGQANYCAG